MIIFWGSKGFQRDGGLIADNTPCSMCGNTEYHRVSRIRQWFTLYWIPLFPFSTKYFKHCPRCGFNEEDKTLRDEFNEGYRAIKQNGQSAVQPQLPQYGQPQVQGQQQQYIPAQGQPVQPNTAPNATAQVDTRSAYEKALGRDM